MWVLRRLGFSEARVEECLRVIQGVDLDEAYEWASEHLISAYVRLTVELPVVFTLPRRGT